MATAQYRSSLRRRYPGVTDRKLDQPTLAPIKAASASKPSNINLTLVLAIVGGSVAAILLLLISFYLIRQYRAKIIARRRNQRDIPSLYNDRLPSDPRYPDERISPYGSPQSRIYYEDAIGPDEGSFVSAGYSSDIDSLDEEDDTHNLVDEFDRFKDRNLERMKIQVEGSVRDVEDMMSHATMMALIDEDDSNRRDVRDFMGGTCGDAIEIEATVLCEAIDWLKRRDGAGLDERKSFLQDILSKMVASVRRELVAPEDASRTIHECAALLGLQLSSDLPETSLIVSGMRQRVLKRDLLEAFEKFGDIDDAAVSSNSRGFGIVRFKSQKSVQRAMEDYRLNNLQVQDVFVHVKVLKYESKGSSPTFNQSESELVRQPSGDLRERKLRISSGLPPPAPTPKPSRESRGRSSSAARSSPAIVGGVNDTSPLPSLTYQSRSRSPVSDSGRSGDRSSSRSRSRPRP